MTKGAWLRHLHRTKDPKGSRGQIQHLQSVPNHHLLVDYISMKPALTSVASYAICSGSRGTFEEDQGDVIMAVCRRAIMPRYTRSSLISLSCGRAALYSLKSSLKNFTSILPIIM